MQAFLHARIEAWSALQRQSSALIVRFNAGQPGVTEALSSLLDQCALSFATHGLSNMEAQLLERKAHLLMAGRGVDPQTLSKHASHRRELVARVAFRVLMETSEQLRSHLEGDAQALASARQLLVPILLAGIQGGIAASVGLDINAPTQAALEAFWRAALGDGSLGPAARQVALMVAQADVVLLLWDLVAALSAVR